MTKSVPCIFIHKTIQGYVIAFDTVLTGKFAVVDTVTNPKKYKVVGRFDLPNEAEDYARNLAFCEVIRNHSNMRM